MLRTACLSAVLLACAPALAQNYAGTYTAKNASGGTVKLTLAHEDEKRVSGTLTGHGSSSLQVHARVEGGTPLRPGDQVWLSFTRYHLFDRASCLCGPALTGFELSITTAVIVAAAGDTPEFCRVSGQIQPEIRFEVGLPGSWNGRLYMFGNGGFAGESLAAGGRSNP